MKKLLTAILLLSLSTLMLAKDIDINKSKHTDHVVTGLHLPLESLMQPPKKNIV